MLTKVSKETGEHLADFTTGSFGDAVVDPETETYTFPTGAQDWAGFANNATSSHTEEGGSIAMHLQQPDQCGFPLPVLPYPM